MGQSWTSGRRRNDYTTTAPLPPLSASNPPPHPRASPPPPPPPPPGPTFAPYPSPPFYYYSQPSACNPYPNNRNFCPYYAPVPPDGAAWWPPQPIPSNYPSSSAWTASMAPAHTPPPYVDHQQAKTIRNDVNVHKDTIRLEVDEESPDQYLVSFTFDAAVDGSITIFYFAKEGNDCTFSSIYPELCKPMRIPFQKGPGQKFVQPSGSSIDLGFFELDDLSNTTNDTFPLVICAEAGQLQTLVEQQEQVPGCAQITLAVIEKKGDGTFEVRVVRQILWVDGHRYELQEIFGLGSSTEAKVGEEEDAGKECVICMSEPRDTAVLPCRHMCMCSECAKALRLQTNKCPICRQPVEQLMEIKVNSGDQ